MRTSALALASVLSLAASSPALGKPLWERAWIEVSTPHFVVASALQEPETTTLASELESFRNAVRQLLNVRVEERVPTRVYVMPGLVRELNLASNTLGWLRPQMRENTAVLRRGPAGLSLTVVLFHEYGHFLTRNQGKANYPRWFDEGFAEVLATMRFEGGKALVGDLVRNRREWLENASWMSFPKLIRTRDVQRLTDEETAKFYAQSWALVHFLLLGPDREKFGERMTSYLLAVEAGTPDGAAFEAAFGIAPGGLERRLRKYFNGREAKILGISLPVAVGGEAPPRVRRVPSDEIAARIGLLCLAGGNLEDARRYFDAALAVNPDSSQALVGVADLHKFAGRFDEAEPYYLRAIANEPQNALHELDYAEYFLDRSRAEQQGDPARAATLLEEARRHFARSYRLDRDNPETLAMNGASYLGDEGASALAVASLEEAHYQLPSQPQIKFLLAQAYIQADRKPEAAELLRSVIAWSHGDASEEARALLAQLESSGPGLQSEMGAQPAQ